MTIITYIAGKEPLEYVLEDGSTVHLPYCSSVEKVEELK